MHSVQEMLAIYPTQTQPHIILQAAPPGRHAAANTAVTKNGNHLNLDKNLVQWNILIEEYKKRHFVLDVC